MRTPKQNAAFARRQKIWRHNSFFGHVAMAQSNMRSIIHSETASHKAKLIAYQIEALTHELREALKDRNDVW